jgi:hypothetical protein
MTLDDALANWAATQRLTGAHSQAIRAAVLREAQADELDVDWLHGLLRPVTALLDGPHGLHETLSRAYLKLA